MKKYLLFCLITCFCLLQSCTNKEKEKEEKIKNVITRFLEDEFFKKNLSLKIIKFQIDSVKYQHMDTLINTILMNEYFRRAYEFNKVAVASSPEDHAPDFAERRAIYAKSSKKWNDIKKIQPNYNSEQVGQVVSVTIKAVDTDQSKNSNNHLWVTFFTLDNNDKIIECGVQLDEIE